MERSGLTKSKKAASKASKIPVEHDKEVPPWRAFIHTGHSNNVFFFNFQTKESLWEIEYIERIYEPSTTQGCSQVSDELMDWEEIRDEQIRAVQSEISLIRNAFDIKDIWDECNALLREEPQASVSNSEAISDPGLNESITVQPMVKATVKRGPPPGLTPSTSPVPHGRTSSTSTTSSCLISSSMPHCLTASTSAAFNPRRTVAVAVIDTCSLLYHPAVVRFCIDYAIDLVIPCMVVRELDGLKKGGKLQQEAKFNAIKAVDVLDRAKTELTFENIYQMRDKLSINGVGFECTANDDYIVKCALRTKLASVHDVPAMLITEDKAMRLKASGHYILSMGAKEFVNYAGKLLSFENVQEEKKDVKQTKKKKNGKAEQKPAYSLKPSISKPKEVEKRQKPCDLDVKQLVMLAQSKHLLAKEKAGAQPSDNRNGKRKGKNGNKAKKIEWKEVARTEALTAAKEKSNEKEVQPKITRGEDMATFRPKEEADCSIVSSSVAPVTMETETSPVSEISLFQNMLEESIKYAWHIVDSKDRRIEERTTAFNDVEKLMIRLNTLVVSNVNSESLALLVDETEENCKKYCPQFFTKRVELKRLIPEIVADGVEGALMRRLLEVLEQYSQIRPQYSAMKVCSE